MRVRSLQMNDAHLYMTPEQFEAEFNAVNEMYLNYSSYWHREYLMRFSTHDPTKLGQKFVDEPELLEKDRGNDAQRSQEFGHQLCRSANEAAFYDEDRRSSMECNRTRFSIATNQVDFAQPEVSIFATKIATTSTRSDLHSSRAAGTHERFIGF